MAPPISNGARDIGETVGEELVRAGIVFAGLDVIGDSLTDVNVTNPTRIVEISAKLLTDACERIAGAEHGRG